MLLGLSTYLPVSRHCLTKVRLHVLFSSLHLGTDEHGSGNAETTVKSPHISNCSVASDYLGEFFVLIIFIFSIFF